MHSHVRSVVTSFGEMRTVSVSAESALWREAGGREARPYSAGGVVKRRGQMRAISVSDESALWREAGGGQGRPSRAVDRSGGGGWGVGGWGGVWGPGRGGGRARH